MNLSVIMNNSTDSNIDNSSSFSTISKIINSTNSNSNSSNDNIIINELSVLINNFKLPMNNINDHGSNTSSISKGSNSDSSSSNDGDNIIVNELSNLINSSNEINSSSDEDIINDFFDSLVRLKIISLLDVLSLISLSSTNKLLRREIDHNSLYWKGAYEELDPFYCLGEYDYSCYCCDCKVPVIIKACNFYGKGWLKFAELLSTPFSAHKATISRAIISSSRSRSYKIPQFIKLAVDEDDYQEEEDFDRLIWVPCTAEGETLCFCFSCIFHDVDKSNKNVDASSNMLIESFENITISDEQNAGIVADEYDSHDMVESTVIMAEKEDSGAMIDDENDHHDIDNDGNDYDEEEEDEDDEDDDDDEADDDDESITINELGFNRFSFPSKPILHLYGYREGAEELSKIASRRGFEHYHGQTIALHGEFEFEGHLFLEIRIALKLIGINSKNGKMARIVIKGCESDFCPNGTMMIFNDVVLDNLEICSMRSHEEDEVLREERYFSAIDVCGVSNSPKFGRLQMTNTIVNAFCGSAIIVSDFGRAYIENSILSSKSFGIDMFLGVVAKNHTVVTVKNCDLRKNQWGLSMGKRCVMTASKERQLRSCNFLKEDDAGITMMYNYRDITINPWYDQMNSDLNEQEVEANENYNDDEVDSH